ncbi:MAG: M48 family metalloprotease [Nitrososphaerota archaeon]|nr:M48 family metalloprotease [Nitrososphaerota archaeon]
MREGLRNALNGSVRFLQYKYRIFFIAGVACTDVILSEIILYIPIIFRLLIAVVFSIFSVGMIFSITQFFTVMTFNFLGVFGHRYAVEKTKDPDADQIAVKIGAPLPKAINVSDNPHIVAVTNVLTGVITISRKLMDDLTREQVLAIITHEIAHLKYRKRFVLELFGVISASLILSLSTLSIAFLISPVIGSLGEISIFMLLLVYVLHNNELRADKEAIKIGLGDHLREVLLYFQRGVKNDEPSETHPSIKTRLHQINRLQSFVPEHSHSWISKIGNLFDTNWTQNYTKPNRYIDNGIFYHVKDYARNNVNFPLTIIDVGCSYGDAPKRMKDQLQDININVKIIGIDISKKVRERAEKNLDGFIQSDILKLRVDDLPLADAVICSFVALWVTPERRSRIIYRCAEQLKDDGALVTNAFPFPELHNPNISDDLCCYVRSLPALRDGIHAYRNEVNQQMEKLHKSYSIIKVGRTEALKYADSILKSWDKLSWYKKIEWYTNLFFNSPLPLIVRLLKSALRRLRRSNA